MNQKQHSSKSLGLKLDLSSIIRGREYSIQSRHDIYTTLPDQRHQKDITNTEPTPESERKTNSISPNHNLNLFYDEKSPEKIASNRASEYELKSPQTSNNQQQQVINSRSEAKNHKNFRDLNKSLATLALKRLTGRSSSDIDAFNSYFPGNFVAGTETKYKKNPDYYYNSSSLYGNKTPAPYSKMDRAFDTPATKKHQIMDSLPNEGQELANFNPLDSPFEDQRNKEQLNLSSNSTNPGNQAIPKRLSMNQNHNTKTAQRNYYHHHHHNTSIGRYQQRKMSNQNIQFYNYQAPNFGTISSNFVITEVNSPYYHRQEMRNLSQYFNDNSLSSIDSSRNQLGSRFSGITDEFRGIDIQNLTSVQSKNNLSNFQSQSRKSMTKVAPSRKQSSQTPTRNNTMNIRSQPQMLVSPKNNSTTPSFKAQFTGQSHFIYDMQQRISRHTKENLDQRQDSTRKLTEKFEEDEKEGIDKRLNFVGSFQARIKEKFDNTFEENPSEKLDKKHVSEGVEYKAGGVGVGNSSSSIKERVNHDRSRENLELVLKQDALQIKREMQKRKQDYEEFNQFFKMYNHDTKHSKHDESNGNSSEKSFSELNTPKLNTKPDVLPTTAVTTQGQQAGNYYHHSIPILNSHSPGKKLDNNGQNVNKQILFEGTLNTGIQCKPDGDMIVDIDEISETIQANNRKIANQVIVEKESPYVSQTSCCGTKIKCRIF